jgi:hypothetical protein
MTKKMVKLFKSGPNTSVRKAGLILNINKSTLCEMKMRSSIKSAKCQLTSKYTEEQFKTEKTNFRKLFLNSVRKTLTFEDETYVMCDSKNIPEDNFIISLIKKKLVIKYALNPKRSFRRSFWSRKASMNVITLRSHT